MELANELDAVSKSSLSESKELYFYIITLQVRVKCL